MVCAGLVFSAGFVLAQTAPGPAILTLDMDFPAASPSHYTLQVAADGSGKYSAGETGRDYRQDFQLSAQAVAPWFARARGLHFFTGNFQSGRKVAFTGTKKISYRGPDGSGAATFVDTEDPQMARLTADLQQLVLTLQTGEMLESHLRHQRMMLDADLDDYQHALNGHMASHPEAIAPALQQIVDSPDAMGRAVRKARAILAGAER